MRRALWGRPGRGQAIVALLLALLGFAAVVQVRSLTADTRLRTARPEELVRILDDVNQRARRLEAERQVLEAQREELATGSDRSAAALEQFRGRADTLAILAGQLPAVGPGVRLTLTDPRGEIDHAVLLDTVQELRDAQAEAIQVNNVRVVASTSFLDAEGGGVLVDGVRVTAPYTVLAIGDPRTMAGALQIPGGVVETVQNRGGTAVVEQSEELKITALHPLPSPQYARPASE